MTSLLWKVTLGLRNKERGMSWELKKKHDKNNIKQKLIEFVALLWKKWGLQ